MKQGQFWQECIRLATVEDAMAIARVHVDSWRTTYRGILSEDYLRSLSYEQRSVSWRRGLSEGTEFVYVAVDDTGQVVGFASGGPEREGKAVYRGELYAIYLLANAQRKGFGRQLLLAVARHLYEQGISGMLVWVLAENPARHFYEAMGGRYVRMKMEAVGGDMLKELAYGWKDIGVLLL